MKQEEIDNTHCYKGSKKVFCRDCPEGEKKVCHKSTFNHIRCYRECFGGYSR